MKKDEYEKAAKALLIESHYKLVDENIKWMSLRIRTKRLMIYRKCSEQKALNEIVQITSGAFSTEDFRQYYHSHLIS
ncbi:hypothetical protein [Lactobacillus crispatus]|uniref:Uncharacterized protein n=1 Tax=Lactobacillus crispatus FB077-07 TaxID=883092 RepID=K1N879_9LACO|nr:hypothetical protein [Lactobacillus crispatus]EKB77785.1 hypothetical protein HMPREF9249_00461 [Lactobacillus crispatus FB077-07]